eukprot:5808749-Prymnesium_polylepis.1
MFSSATSGSVCDAIGRWPSSSKTPLVAMLRAALRSRLTGALHSGFWQIFNPLISLTAWLWSSARRCSAAANRRHSPPHLKCVAVVLCSGVQATTIPFSLATRRASDTPMVGGRPLFPTPPGRPAILPQAPHAMTMVFLVLPGSNVRLMSRMKRDSNRCRSMCALLRNLRWWI